MSLSSMESNSSHRPRVGITMGDPGGIGPEIGKADERSLLAALRYAVDLAPKR
jgi:4-hydroxy-L-threonine phosphate dehydrogenase PdxA